MRTKEFYRRIDNLGRICIPSFMRKSFELEKEVEITIEYGMIYIKRFNPNNIEKREYVGIVKRFDEIGRVVIPVEMLMALGIKKGQKVYCDMFEKQIRLIVIKDEE